MKPLSTESSEMFKIINSKAFTLYVMPIPHWFNNYHVLSLFRTLYVANSRNLNIYTIEGNTALTLVQVGPKSELKRQQIEEKTMMRKRNIITDQGCLKM